MNRRLIWQLAFRYMRGKRTGNAVPILSRISIIAITITSAAMIIIFSGTNGLVELVKEQYKVFYPDIKISAVRGKFFAADPAKLAAIKSISGVQYATTSIEDNAFVASSEQQKVITIKGIEPNFMQVNDLRDRIIEGDDSVSTTTQVPTAIAGKSILNELGSNTNALTYLNVNYANPEAKDIGADPLSAFQTLRLHPAGVFSIDGDFDNKYLLAPLSLVQELFHQQGHCSSIEIKTIPGKEAEVQQQLQKLLGTGYKVQTRYEQNSTLYKVMGAEKWAIYAILVLVLLIASFNMIGALSMLVLEKQKDIGILKAMGADNATIRMIFFAEGLLWSLTGGIAGIIIGETLCLLQQKFGFQKMGAGFLVDAYPIQTQWQDVFLVLITTITVGVLTSWYPSLRATRTHDLSLKST